MSSGVDHPVFAVTLLRHIDDRAHRPGLEETVLGEFGIDIGVPVQHIEQILQVVVVLFGNILHHQVPRHAAAFH